MGHVITFYSYKGGVGRSMALANISVALAQFGHNVLIVDWDLEAPGIEEYFRPYLKIQEVIRQRGIVDLLWNEFQQESRPKDREDWQSLIIKVKVPNAKGNLHILTAGRKDEEYFGKVQSLDFQRFYEQKNGGVFIEMLRDEWKIQYDFILVDSRTGITDIGGICTIQLPDTLVLMFTATEEALSGAINVAHKVQVAHQSLPYDRLSITCIPIPARFDTQTEFKSHRNGWIDFHPTFRGCTQIGYQSQWNLGKYLKLQKCHISHILVMAKNYQLWNKEHLILLVSASRTKRLRRY